MKNIYLLAVCAVFILSSCIEIYQDPVSFPELEVEHTTVRDFSSLLIQIGKTNDTTYARGTEMVEIKLFNSGDGVAYDVEYEIIKTQRDGKVLSDKYYVGDIYSYEGLAEVVEYRFQNLIEIGSYEVIALWC